MKVRYAFLALVFYSALALNAFAQESTVLTLNRDHAGDDCVWGPMTVEHDEVAWALERPWKGRKPVLSKLLPGTYPAKATYRARTGIKLVFTDLPDPAPSVLMLGAHTGNGAGRVAISLDVVGNCRVNSGKGYPVARNRLTRRVFGTAKPANGQSTDLQVRIVDR